MMLKLKGIIVPIVTPFDIRNQLDTSALLRLIDFLIERGVHALFPAGTTGEGPLLSTAERCQLAEAVVQATDGRLPVIIHAGAISTAETQALTQHAQSIGATAAAVIAPFFYRHSDEALFRHFEAIASHTPDFPIYLYNFPAVTGNNLSTALIIRLREHCPNIVGMKDSSGSLESLFTLAAQSNGAFNTASGSDGQALAALSLGLDACVSGNANVVPELMVALYQAAIEGNLIQTRKLQHQVNAVRALLADGGNLSLFKEILARRGVPVGTVRPPLLQAPEETVARCWQSLQELGLKLLPVV